MTDRIYLSLWLRGHSVLDAITSLDRVLEVFPVSRFQPNAALRIYALELAEPALLDREFDEAQVDEIIEAAREFENPDCAYEVTVHWDLWKRDATWGLGPSPVRIVSFGREFESDLGEQIQIDLGQDYLYLPLDEQNRNWTALRSNVRSLLRFARDIEERLPVSKRTLWSDSDDDLAERLEEVIAGE